jgi:hypothetical protein
MLSLIYVSSATWLFSDEELEALLEQCREKNARLGVTGMLLYKDGNFMQVLEGEDTTVRQLAAEIEMDRRHKNFTILTEEPITQRQFSDWSMAFNHLNRSDRTDVPGYSRFLDERLNPEVLGVPPEGSWKLLMTFREHN